MDALRRQRVGGLPAGALVVVLWRYRLSRGRQTGRLDAPQPGHTLHRPTMHYAPAASPAALRHPTGIAALSHANIWAVGANTNVVPTRPLIEHWDGLFLHVVSDAPAPKGSSAPLRPSLTLMYGPWAPVVCSEHYDGRRWAIVPSPAAYSLSGSGRCTARRVGRGPGHMRAGP